MLFPRELSNSGSSIHERLRNNIARMEDSLKETGLEAGLAGILPERELTDRYHHEDLETMRRLEGYPIEYGMGGDYDLEGRYISSMKKMIDEADRLVQEQRLPEQYFLQEDLNIINTERIGQPDILQGGLEDFNITPGKIRDIEQHYLQETAQQTAKQRRGQRTITERIEQAIQNFEELSKIKVTYEEILDRIIGKEIRPALDTIMEQNEEMQDLFDVIEGRKEDDSILNNLREMNRLYFEAIEVGRAEERLKTESGKNVMAESESRQKPSDKQFSGEVGYGEEYQIDHGNLDIIMETFNENITKTNYMTSYQVWTKLNFQGQLTRRSQRSREFEGHCRET